MFQRTWHGIDLTQLPAAANVKDTPAGPEFYTEFYRELAARGSGSDPLWEQSKIKLGETILAWMSAHEKQAGRPPKVLAIAVGKGLVERAWVKYDLTFHDCQESSLKPLREEFPEAKYLVGDVQSLRFDTTYDIVTLIGIDYVLTRSELALFLNKVGASLAEGGQVLLYCPNILSIKQAAKECVKKLISFYKKVPHVFWGYYRTPAEFFAAAKLAELRVENVFRVTADGLKKVPGGLAKVMPWRSPDLILTFRKP